VLDGVCVEGWEEMCALEKFVGSVALGLGVEDFNTGCKSDDEMRWMRRDRGLKSFRVVEVSSVKGVGSCVALERYGCLRVAAGSRGVHPMRREGRPGMD
jgi:hypothetical protein